MQSNSKIILCGGGALIKSSVKNTKALQQSFILKTNTLINKEIQTNKANSTLTILNQATSFSKPIIQAIVPSMLATASILSTPLEAAWQSSISNAVTCNSPCQVTGNKTAAKDTIIWISHSGGDLTINSGAIVSNTKANGHNGNDDSRVIEINNAGTVGTITNKGTISGAGIGIRVKGKVDTIIIESGATIYGKQGSFYNTGTITKGITIASGASVTGIIDNYEGGTIGNINIKGKVTALLQNLAIQNIGTITGSINIASGASVMGIVLNAGVISGGITISSGGSVSGEIENQGSISGGITIAEGSSVEGYIANFGTIAKKIEIASDSSVRGSIHNLGNVQEEIKVAGNVGGEIIVYGGASAKNISISGGSVGGGIKNEGVVSQAIKVSEGSNIGGNIENSGQVAQAIEISGKVGGEITITEKASVGSGIKIEQGANIAKGITNSGNISGGITIAQSANLSGKIENKKDATIAGGITNNSDNKLVVNSEGKIEKNAKGDTITNNGKGGVEVEAFLVVGNSNGVPEKLIIGGSGDQSKNKTGKLTIDTSVDTKELAKGGFALVEGVNKENVGTFAHIDPEIQIEIERTIFSQNSNKVGRTVTKALSASADKRANFAETTMNNSLKGLSHSLKQQMRATIGSNSLDRDAMYASAGLNDFTTSFDLPNP